MELSKVAEMDESHNESDKIMPKTLDTSPKKTETLSKPEVDLLDVYKRQVVPSVCLIFCWRYMFNNIYGIINYFLVDILHVVDKAPLWFDSPVSAFVLVALFNVWRFFPYAYMSFVAIMTDVYKRQIIPFISKESLYE